MKTETKVENGVTTMTTTLDDGTVFSQTIVSGGNNVIVTGNGTTMTVINGKVVSQSHIGPYGDGVDQNKDR